MTNANKERYQRPEGRLIEQALKKRVGFSNRDLAKLVGLSEGRIRQIINGYRTEAGTVLEISAPVDTLVRIANALDIGPDALSKAGRSDAADVLRDNPRVGVTETGALWLAGNQREHDLMRAWLDDPTGKPPTMALQLWSVDDLLEAASKKHRDEMQLLNHVIDMMSKGGDGNADADARGSAPTSQGDYDLVAHDEEHTIESEQGHDDNA